MENLVYNQGYIFPGPSNISWKPKKKAKVSNHIPPMLNTDRHRALFTIYFTRLYHLSAHYTSNIFEPDFSKNAYLLGLWKYVFYVCDDLDTGPFKFVRDKMDIREFMTLND